MVLFYLVFEYANVFFSPLSNLFLPLLISNVMAGEGDCGVNFAVWFLWTDLYPVPRL